MCIAPTWPSYIRTRLARRMNPESFEVSKDYETTHILETCIPGGLSSGFDAVLVERSE